MATSMKPSRSQFHDLGEIRYHVRTWGDPGHPTIFMLHGWMDVSASFQFAVDALTRDWYVVAPDWRGFGQSGRAAGGYWFADYIADLDALLDLYSPAAPALVVGHSMGGNIANLHAGVRPDRIAALVLAEGFGLRATDPASAPERYAKWLDQRKLGAVVRPYADFAAVAARLMKNNPRLRREQADFLAQHWARATADGTIELAADPRHKLANPVLYRLEEAIACWRRITAPVLWIWGGDGESVYQWMGNDPAEWAARRAAYGRLTECRIPDAGHMMHHDQPLAFANAIEHFLVSNAIAP